ncbi:glycosyltransferase family 1 protein [Brevundimonas sp.]|uniref:glycosyltransferase family 4 protein n=1 Tax=Brevundimonas sp. TaxID=1871086 RepID=UPI0024877FAB|nr:glycosyltransferase family 1 protein [Brevundimonas sp.]MDI1281536.1 glycosyltransferase family 1 protein [Brevundimonas sp.]
MKPVILFDAGRLLDRTTREAPTGVDRVCLAYAEWLAGRRDIRVVPVATVRNRLRAVETARYRRDIRALRSRWSGEGAETPAEQALVRALTLGTGDQSILDAEPAPPALSLRRVRAVGQALTSRPLPETRPGTAYVSVGHTALNTPTILADLARRGVSSTIMIHDLIPITHPEFCRPGDQARHHRRVCSALRHAGRIIVNSNYTADQLLTFAAAEALPPPPVRAIPLGLEPVFLTRGTTPSARPYFVHVGTIEARKNLALLLTLWRRLQERMGAATPGLVLIGRYGWENEAVLDHLQRSPNLQGLVHQSAGLSDASLARLMRGARAVVAPSSIEGFDLPAVEAMAMGVPLIASDIPVHRELVSGARLIDPLDGLGWLSALQAAAETPPVAPAYDPPTWAAHFTQVAAFIGLAA